MRATLAKLLASRKFVVMLGSVIAYAASRAGLNISAEQALPAIGLVGSYIIGQGIADHGQATPAQRAAFDAALARVDAAAAKFEASLATMKMPP